jgi:hypothetical protein
MDENALRWRLKLGRNGMKLTLILVCVIAMSLLVGAISAQDANTKHFAKDGLSFDYPSGWTIDESKSSSQMQYLTLGRDGYAMLIVRAPRAVVDTPDKEAHSKKLVQDGFIDAWMKNFESTGAKPERSVVATEIAGGPAECARLSASLEGEPGHIDVCWRILDQRMLQLAIIGSNKDVTRTSPTWDVVRNSLKIEPPQPKGSPSPTPKGK